MASNLLTDAKARNAKPGRYPDGENLYLQVSAKGSKSWLLRYTLGDKRHEMGLGSYPAVSIDLARKSAQAARAARAEGKNPLAYRSEAQAALCEKAANHKTFEEVAKELISLKDSRGHWGGFAYEGKSRAQWESTLSEFAYPVFGSKDVNAVNSADVVQALSPIWSKINETARRVRGRVEKVLDYAAAMKYRNADKANAAQWKGPLEYALAGGGKQRTRAARHLPSLPFAQMYDFMQKLRARPERSARLLEWTILSAVRTTEARLASRSEVDERSGVWTVPGPRMKMKRAHRVPLSPRMLELLAECGKDDGYLFRNQWGMGIGNALSTAAMDQLLGRMGYAHVTVHGFRSTFKTWATEETDCHDIISEMALAHRIPEAQKAAYLRGDALEKRRPLMAQWAEFCNTEYRPAVVVPLRKAA